MAKIVHIVNGDSTASILSKSFLKGDIVVWREIFCEGPLHKNFASDEFWKLRYKYMNEAYGIDKLQYFDTTIKEIIKLEELPKNAEIVLWFEYDLFCQINLLATCTMLLNFYRKDLKYRLVCVGKRKGSKSFVSLSDYSFSEYGELYKNAEKLTRNNLLYAKECWDVFVENNEVKLKKFDFGKSSKFKYLQTAINQHLKGAQITQGLNEIELKILEIIDESHTNEEKIIEKLLHWQQLKTVYGFGDMQYLNRLKNLKKYYTISNGEFYLNNEGKILVL